uniref:Uncharacterized protein n=1 Tax=Labrus bergylta TaxID=56723 RepID=A0A3Q3FUN6_9LABR
MNQNLKTHFLCTTPRVRALGKMGYSVEINEDIEPRRYFRSGLENAYVSTPSSSREADRRPIRFIYLFY